MLKTTVLIDNAPGNGLQGEWGLSFHAGYGGLNFLVDAGSTGLFLRNAESLGIDLSTVDAAFLSHAHYDHAGGMGEFLDVNRKAPLFVSPSAAANCYSGNLLTRHYIGLPTGFIEDYGGRLERRSGVFSPFHGVWVVPHSSAGLGAVGRRARMYVKRGWRFVPDDFSHEQSVVFQTGDGLAVFSSCSHAGPAAVLSEVMSAIPGIPVTAYIGGLHLFRADDGAVRDVASAFSGAGVRTVWTGHCTGERAFGIIRDSLGDGVRMFHTGDVFEI